MNMPSGLFMKDSQEGRIRIRMANQDLPRSQRRRLRPAAERSVRGRMTLTTKPQVAFAQRTKCGLDEPQVDTLCMENMGAVENSTNIQKSSIKRLVAYSAGVMLVRLSHLFCPDHQLALLDKRLWD